MTDVQEKRGALSDGDLTRLVRNVIAALDDGGIAGVPVALERLRAAGIVANIHVGRTDMSPRETVEWYAGQILDVLQQQSWFAVNSLVNVVDKFAPRARVERSNDE